MTIYLSGIQPTGNIHIGNYFGAIKQFISLSSNSKSQNMFFIADLHAFTTSFKNIKENSIKTVALYIACGVNLKNSYIYLQSDINSSLDIMWFLSSVASMSELSLMTQYKSKLQNYNNLSLFSYPVLMASDILSQQANYVPVGQDQKQHIELTRNLAQKVNKRFNKKIFEIPNPLILNNGSKIMSLTNGLNKMSKSDSNKSRINLMDSNENIMKKILKAKTDSLPFDNFNSISEMTINNNIKIRKRPEIFNLINIMSLLSNKNIIEICDSYNSFSVFKKDLADIIIDKIHPIREKTISLLKEKDYIESILKRGAEKARISSEVVKKKLYDSIFV